MPFPFPMSPFLAILAPPLFACVGIAGTGVRGVPGEVGGLASGAELMEWAPRLCVYDEVRTGKNSGLRVLVKVIVTENGSPAK